MNNSRLKNKQNGFTLIELMVSITISGFLLLAIMVTFDSANRSRALQTSLSGINESGRFAISVMSRDIRMAGYREDDFMAGALPDSITAVNRDADDGGDTITLQYQAAKDCNYTDAPLGLATNVYAVNPDTFALECNGQPLVDDVEQMQVYFGEDITGDGVANRMMAPNNVALDMTRVVSLRLNLLVRSENDQQSAVTQNYFFDDTNWDAEDDRIRRQYSITIALRNPT